MREYSQGEHRESRLRTHTGCAHEIAVPAEYFLDTIRNQLCSLLEEDALKDTKIALRARSLKMSSCMLSLLSPVLRRMVCGNFRESISKEISLDDVEADLLLKLLRIACGKEGAVADDAEELLELGELADRLQMDAVRVVVEGKLLKELKVENCLEMVQRSEVSGLKLLQNECYSLLRDEFQVFSQNEGFLKVSEETVRNLLDDDELWVDREEDVFDVLMKWMTNNDEGILGERLLRKIRYGVMSKEYINRLMSSPLPGNAVLKELLGETIVKMQGGTGMWDGVERLCDKWKVARMKGRIIGADLLEQASYIAVDREGRFVVSDAELHQIIVFNRDGSVARRIGSHGTAAGQFDEPTGIAVDRHGHIIVADSNNDRIQILNVDGTVVRCFGTSGSEVGELVWPYGVAIDKHGNIVVADSGNDRIQVFDANGSVVRHFGSAGAATGQLTQPLGVAVDEVGRIVVADCGNARVQVFNSDGSLALCFGSKGDGPGKFRSPYGVAVDSAGRFVVADDGSDLIQVFNSDGSLGRVMTVGSEDHRRRSRGVVVDGRRIVVAHYGDGYGVQMW